MNFWNVRIYARSLKENKVTEIEELRAFMNFTIILWISVHLLARLDWIEVPMMFGPGFLITVFGILWCFKANCQGDNKDFITRIVCLSYLVGKRILVIGLITGPIIGLSILLIPEPALINLLGNKYPAVLNTTIGSVFYIVYFAWIRFCMLYVSGVTKYE